LRSLFQESGGIISSNKFGDRLVNDSLSNAAFVVAPAISTNVLALNVRAVGLVPMFGSIAALAIGYRLFMRPTATLAPQSE
jgi:hypothetical protein